MYTDHLGLSALVAQLSASYRTDAEALCEKLCVLLDSAANQGEYLIMQLRHHVFHLLLGRSLHT